MTFQPIIVPTDLSQASNEALKWGVQLAGSLESRLVALNVCEEISAFLAAQIDQHSEGRVGYEERLLAERRAELRNALQEIPGHDQVETDVLLKAGYPPHEIAEAVQELDAGLVVLTTHGRTGFRHALLGSVAEKVIRIVQTPLLALKSGAVPRVRRILYAADLSDESFSGFWFARRLAGAFDAEIHLVHVVNDSERTPMVSWHHLPTLTPSVFAAQFEKAAENELQTHLDTHNPDRTPVTIHLRRGVVYEEILNLSEQMEADLVVLTTHGRKGLPHLVLGSVAERVMRLAPMPVATLPRKKISG